MNYSDQFYNEFMQYAKANNKMEANNVLMKELGRILVEDRDNFIYVLRHAGITVPDTASDIDLINLFIRNIPRNKTLLLGSAFIMSHHNKMVGFDGEEYTSNICANAMQKSMYSYFTQPVYYSFFDGEKFSYEEGPTGAASIANVAKGGATGGLAGTIAGAIGEGFKWGGQASANKGKKLENSPLSLLAKQQAAKAQITQSVIDQKTKALENKKDTEKSKRTKMIIIGSVAGVALLGIGIALFLKYRKK